jgi:hypothetical protein
MIVYEIYHFRASTGPYAVKAAGEADDVEEEEEGAGGGAKNESTKKRQLFVKVSEGGGRG